MRSSQSEMSVMQTPSVNGKQLKTSSRGRLSLRNADSTRSNTMPFDSAQSTKFLMNSLNASDINPPESYTHEEEQGLRELNNIPDLGIVIGQNFPELEGPRILERNALQEVSEVLLKFQYGTGVFRVHVPGHRHRCECRLEDPECRFG